MTNFLIFYAPLITIVIAVATAFIVSAKSTKYEEP